MIRFAGGILRAPRDRLLHWLMTSRIGPDTAARIAKAWPELIGAFADGQLVRDTLNNLGLTRNMLRAYLVSNPQARVEWDAAREQSADALFEDALETAYNPRLDPAHARMRADVLKWAARIRNPKLYGDKAQLDVNVRTVDLTRIIESANARLHAAQSMRTIGPLEHEPMPAARVALADLM